MENNINGRRLLKLFFLNFFTSDTINSVINILIPVIISIYCTICVNKTNLIVVTCSLCLVVFVFNVLSSRFRKKEGKKINFLNLIFKSYNEQSLINSKAATNIFRLNKAIEKYISDNIPVSKQVFDKIADFQTTAFIISQSIHSLLKQEFGEDIKCEVTIMKKELYSTIKMIAYANNNNKLPSSYNKTYSFNEEDIFFVKLFKDPDSEIKCLSTKMEVQDKFKKLKGSKKREDEICQYIGIPIKTNRNIVELLLQIDVSKEKIFGTNEAEVVSFAKNILEPYAVLLHKAYERDLIFNKYYDMIISYLNSK